MAIAFDSSTAGGGFTTGGSFSVPTSPTGGTLLLIAIRNSTIAVTGLTVGSQSPTLISQSVDPFDTSWWNIYQLANATPGSQTVSWSNGGSAQIGAYTGVVTSSPIDAFDIGTTSTSSRTVTVSGANEWLWYWYNGNNSQSISTGSVTDRYGIVAGPEAADSHGTVSSGSQTVTTSGATTQFTNILVAFKPFIASRVPSFNLLGVGS